MLVEELQYQIQQIQPDLLVSKSSYGFEIGGIFRIIDPAGILLDEFQIYIETSADPLLNPPRVWEVGARLPQITERHINPGNGTLCYLTPEDFFLWRAQSAREFTTFLSGPLRDYFISQICFEETNEWPFGDRRHGPTGRIQFYIDLFGSSDFVFILASLQKILARKFKGHHACTCGSCKQIRHCHSNIILAQINFSDSLLKENCIFLNKSLAIHAALSYQDKQILSMTKNHSHQVI